MAAAPLPLWLKAALLVLLLALVALGRWLAGRFGWDLRLTVLATLVLAWALLSLVTVWQRRSLRRRLSALDAAQRQALAQADDNVRYAFASPTRRPLWQLTVVGRLWVLLPLLPLLLAPFALLQQLWQPAPPWPQLLTLGLGMGLAWAWGQWAGARWWSWAMRQGLSADEARYHGQQAGILTATACADPRARQAAFLQALDTALAQALADRGLHQQGRGHFVGAGPVVLSVQRGQGRLRGCIALNLQRPGQPPRRVGAWPWSLREFPVTLLLSPRQHLLLPIFWGALVADRWWRVPTHPRARRWAIKRICRAARRECPLPPAEPSP